MGDMIDRAVIRAWLEAKALVWSSEDIPADHLLKLLVGEVEHLPAHLGEDSA